MKRDNLYLNNTGRDRLVLGIKKAAAAVGCTMGTGGSNAIIQTIERPGHLATNDGATILSSIRFADPIEEMGRGILLEAVSRANKASGDGSSTTTVLTANIIEEGLRHLSDENPMEIKRTLEACIPIIEETLRSISTEIDVKDVSTVATISAEDADIGNLIQEIYEKIGKDGIIHWDVSKTNEDSYTIGSGIVVEGAGFLSPYMCDIDEKTGVVQKEAKFKDIHVLLVKQKITSAADFNDLFSKLYAKEIKEVVVFCDEIEAMVIPDLLQTRQIRGFNTMVVKMPVIWKDLWYTDLSKATGATIIESTGVASLKTMGVEHLGKVDHIRVTAEDTYLDGILDVSEHVAELEADGTDDSKLRASRLNTKTARLFIGANSDSALSYKRLKIEDAISAAWQALHGGVVPGGGTALLQAAFKLNPFSSVGAQILYTALQAPAKQIASNVHTSFEVDKYKDGIGLNTSTMEYVNMVDTGIIDPTNVVINAVKNAVSVAAQAITSSTIVLLPVSDEKI